MRVTGGEFGSRLLKVPKSARPTTDRARVAIFNMLQSEGGMVDYEVVDLFSGSGSLGIEALSRGAGFVTFVESDREANEVIKQNLKSLGIETAKVVKGSVESFVTNMKPVDFVFVDPPFAYGDDEWKQLLSGIRAKEMMCESNRVIEHLLAPGWNVVRSRKYGDSVVVIARRDDDSGIEG